MTQPDLNIISFSICQSQQNHGFEQTFTLEIYSDQVEISCETYIQKSFVMEEILQIH